MVRRSDAISPTAHYTGYTWYHHGMSHPALVTSTGRLMFAALSPMQSLAHLTGVPSLQDVLLARHRILDQLLTQAIDDGRITQVIEVAAGLSPRGWSFKQRYGSKLRYIEADLPDMAERKRTLLHDAGLQRSGHEVVALNALADAGPQALSTLARSLDPHQGLAIITEGLLNYFDMPAVLGMWARFSQVLAGFQHGLYLSDLHLDNVPKSMAIRGFKALVSTVVRGRVHLHFDSDEAAGAALSGAGFEVGVLHRPSAFALQQGWEPQAGVDLVRVLEAWHALDSNAPRKALPQAPVGACID
ncbi:MAG: class I SAM-dependent methyltransferase [Pseudomonadota bacterium]